MRVLSKILPHVTSVRYTMHPDLNHYRAKIEVSIKGTGFIKRVEARTYTEFNRKLTEFYNKVHTLKASRVTKQLQAN